MTEPRHFPSRQEIHGQRSVPQRPESENEGPNSSDAAVPSATRSAVAPPSRRRADRHASSKKRTRRAHRLRPGASTRSGGSFWYRWGIPSLAFWITVASLVGIGFGAYEVRQGALPPVLEVTQIFDPVHVAGKLGGPPVVTLDSPIAVDQTATAVIYHGAGREVSAGTPVLLSVSAYDARAGLNLSETGQPSLVVGDADASSIGATLADVVIGNKEGSRILTARRLDSGQTEINIVDILYTIARGETMDVSEGPLTVTAAEEGISVSHADGEAPYDLSVQVLIQGDGQQISPNDEVVAQYLAVGWDDGSTLASTWDQGAPRVIELETAMPGIREALVDRRVGSRLAITIPPEKATGEGTLCIVVDILGTSGPIGTDLGSEDE